MRRSRDLYATKSNEKNTFKGIQLSQYSDANRRKGRFSSENFFQSRSNFQIWYENFQDI